MSLPLWRKDTLNQQEQCAVDAMRRHVAHGHGEILIQVRPGSVRVQEGLGHLFETART